MMLFVILKVLRIIKLELGAYNNIPIKVFHGVGFKLN